MWLDCETKMNNQDTTNTAVQLWLFHLLMRALDAEQKIFWNEHETTTSDVQNKVKTQWLVSMPRDVFMIRANAKM